MPASVSAQLGQETRGASSAVTAPMDTNALASPQGCSLVALLEAMQDNFSHIPPVYSKPARAITQPTMLSRPPVGPDYTSRPPPPVPGTHAPTPSQTSPSPIPAANNDPLPPLPAKPGNPAINPASRTASVQSPIPHNPALGNVGRSPRHRCILAHTILVYFRLCKSRPSACALRPLYPRIPRCHQAFKRSVIHRSHLRIRCTHQHARSTSAAIPAHARMQPIHRHQRGLLRLITDWLDHNRYHRRPVVLRFPRSSRRPLSHLIPRTRRAYQVCYRMEPIHCLCLQPECSQGGRPLHFPRPLCRPSQRQTMCRLTTTDHRPSSRPPRHSLRRCPHMRRTSSHRTYSTHRTSLTCRV